MRRLALEVRPSFSQPYQGPVVMLGSITLGLPPALRSPTMPIVSQQRSPAVSGGAAGVMYIHTSIPNYKILAQAGTIRTLAQPAWRKPRMSSVMASAIVTYFVT